VVIIKELDFCTHSSPIEVFILEEYVLGLKKFNRVHTDYLNPSDQDDIPRK
jgi:hypothetical protein